ncbi:Uncharacterised protein [Vibrio cholerae]|nr:Uncharacterised protein [Vibrio cholerae]
MRRPTKLPCRPKALSWKSSPICTLTSLSTLNGIRSLSVSGSKSAFSKI